MQYAERERERENPLIDVVLMLFEFRNLIV